MTSLCNNLGNAGAKVGLLVVGHEVESGDWVLPNPASVELRSSPGWCLPGLNFTLCPGFVNHIINLHATRSLDVIHDHGLWLPSNHASVRAAKSLDIPLIISTRGMLAPWALKYRGWKKIIVWHAWQKTALEGAAVLHATSPEEAENLRALGFKNPIAVIPNGVDLPELDKKCCGTVKTALFLSRIHPIKGLLNLVVAWTRVKPHGWRMIIAGPSEGTHEDDVKRAVKFAGLEDQFEFIGPVDDLQKWALYRQADIFILPSFSENFGIAIAEALASELPVITTKGTPWFSLDDHCCGWWVDIGTGPLEIALKEAMSLSDGERLNMGRRGRVLIKENYSWEKIALDMLSVYMWVHFGGKAPDCVRLY